MNKIETKPVNSLTRQQGSEILVVATEVGTKLGHYLEKLIDDFFDSLENNKSTNNQL